MNAKINYVCNKENIFATTYNANMRPNKDDIILLYGKYYKINKIVFEADVPAILIDLERIPS